MVSQVNYGKVDLDQANSVFSLSLFRFVSLFGKYGKYNQEKNLTAL